MIYLSYYDSIIGKLILTSEDDQLTGLWMENQKYCMETIKKEYEENDEDETIIKTKNWLDRYFNKQQPAINELILNPDGTSFQHQVWAILCEIPYGQTITYSAIAKIIAKKRGINRMSAQAIGQAVGHNPISIIIPCHRVIGSDGSLTGYSGGVDKKSKLLEFEGVKVENNCVK